MDNLVDRFACHLGLTTATAVGTAAIATTSTVLAPLGALDPQGTTAKVFAVQLFDHSISNLFVIDVGEPETTGRACFTIQN